MTLRIIVLDQERSTLDVKYMGWVILSSNQEYQSIHKMAIAIKVTVSKADNFPLIFWNLTNQPI